MSRHLVLRRSRVPNRIRLRGRAVVVVIALLVGACDETTYCECPAAETAIAGIDWFGDGEASVIRAQYDENTRSLPPTALLNRQIDDATERLAFIDERLRDAGFEPVPSNNPAVTRLALGSTRIGFRETDNYVSITVVFDPQQLEAFDVAAEALGTVDEP
jgi:hypothetical protein